MVARTRSCPLSESFRAPSVAAGLTALDVLHHFGECTASVRYTGAQIAGLIRLSGCNPLKKREIFKQAWIVQKTGQ